MTSLRQRIYEYHKKRPGVWVPKGELLRLITARTTYTADNAGRRLRELAEDGLLRVKQVKNHSFYCYEPTLTAVKEVEIINGRAVEKTVTKMV